MKRKQISLIIPKPTGMDAPQLYHGIWSVGSYLKQKGFDVKIYDEQFDEASDNMKEILENSFVVGFTVMTVQLQSARDLSKIVHKAGVPVVWGGVHPTLFPAQCVKEEYIDYVVYDEGEVTMAEICETLLKQEFKELKDIKGVFYKHDGKAVNNEPRQYININDISPDYDLLNPQRYVVKQRLLGKWRDVLSVETGRGCYFRCSFCINTLLNQRKWRGRSAEKIVGEIKRLSKHCKIDHLFFLDENFFTDKNRVNSFCDLYKKEKFRFTWSTTSRVNYLRTDYIDDALLHKLKECNCIELQMGIESGSQRVLDEIIFKDILVEDAILGVKRLKKVKIQPTCSFMIGLPNETVEEQRETLDLIKKLWSINKDVYILGPQLYRPYPGARMYSMAQELGFKAPKNINAWIVFLNSAGFLNTDNFPWIKNKSELENISKYFTYSQISPRGINYLFSIFFKNIFLLRIRYGFYKLGFDLFIFEKLKNLYFRIKASAADPRAAKSRKYRVCDS